MSSALPNAEKGLILEHSRYAKDWLSGIELLESITVLDRKIEWLTNLRRSGTAASEHATAGSEPRGEISISTATLYCYVSENFKPRPIYRTYGITHVSGTSPLQLFSFLPCLASQ